MAVKAACGNGFPLNIPSVIPESGGSGGTSDYSDLTNKPKINSVTLSGNKTAADLGLASADIEDLIPADASSSNQLATAADLPGMATTSAPGIVQPDGTSITISDGVISAIGGSGGETYSAAETIIGSWLGDPLYRKVVSLGALSDGTSYKPATIGASVTMRNMRVLAYAVGYQVQLPFLDTTLADSIGVAYLPMSNTSQPDVIRIVAPQGATIYTSAYAVLEYTKDN